MTLQEFKYSSKKYAPEILTAIGVGGQVGSNLLFIRAEKLYLQDGKKSHFLLPSLVSLGSIAAIIGSNRLSNTQKVSLAAATAALATKYTADRKAIKDKYGEDTLSGIDLERFVKAADKTNFDKMIDDDEEDRQIFYIEEYGIIFVSSMAKVTTAELNINEKFVHEGYATLKQFFECLGIPLSDVDKDAYNKIGWRFNWEDYDAGIQYITFDNYMKVVPFEGRNVPCHFIEFNEEALPMNEWTRIYDDGDEYGD